MLMKKAIALGVATLAAALFSPPVSAANLVANGDFSSTTNGVNKTLYGGDPAAKRTSLTSWTVLPNALHPNGTPTIMLVGPNWTNPSINTTPAGGAYGPAGGNFLIANPFQGKNNGFTDAPSGHNYIMSDGDSNLNGAIQQQITGLTTGGFYAVSFWWATGQQLNAPLGTSQGVSQNHWQVTFGGDVQNSSTKTTPYQGFNGWTKETLTFTAASATQALSFLAVSTPDGIPPMLFLSDVSVMSVPEPSAVVMLGLGFAGLAALRLRGRKAR